MPSIHIPEGAFTTLADELGYEGAKARIKELAHEEARGLADE